jgi:hypothetical protein
MGYVIADSSGNAIERFNNGEELNTFIQNVLDEVPTGSSGLAQFVWPDNEALITDFNDSDEIGKTSFNFIYTTEEFENLSNT